MPPSFESKKVWNNSRTKTPAKNINSKVFRVGAISNDQKSEQKIGLGKFDFGKPWGKLSSISVSPSSFWKGKNVGSNVNQNTDQASQPKKEKSFKQSFSVDYNNKKPKFKFPSPREKLQQIKEGFYDNDQFREFNHFVQSRFLRKGFNQFLMRVLASFLTLFVVYLSFFDTFFLITSYSFEINTDSYLNRDRLTQITTQLNSHKTFEVFPDNQFWFVNSPTLTASANEKFDFVEKVEVTSRIWPNKIALKVETTPNLATLQVTENGEIKFWRVSTKGAVLTEDNAGIKDNLVTVEKPYELTINNKKKDSKPTLENYNFGNNPIQIGRFQLSKKLRNIFESRKIGPQEIKIPSIVDSDITIISKSGTAFMFDSELFDQELQLKRLEEFFRKIVDGKSVSEIEKSGQLKYVDFRVKKKIYYCYKGQNC